MKFTWKHDDGTKGEAYIIRVNPSPDKLINLLADIYYMGIKNLPSTIGEPAPGCSTSSICFCCKLDFELFKQEILFFSYNAVKQLADEFHELENEIDTQLSNFTKFEGMNNMTSSCNDTGIPVQIKIGSDQFSVTLDNEPLVLGREVEDLPQKVLAILESDDYISRQHCQIWFEDATHKICIANLSDNGSMVNGNTLAKDEACKLNLDSSIDLQVGKTRLQIEPQRVKVELPKPVIQPIQINSEPVSPADSKTRIMPPSFTPDSEAAGDDLSRYTPTGSPESGQTTSSTKSFFSFLPLFTSKVRLTPIFGPPP